MFPLVSIEALLVLATRLGAVPGELVVLIALGALGHQVAKTLTYYAGAGMFELPRSNMRARIEAAKARIERWNKRPRLIMFIAAATGLPPLYLLGFIARPVMKMRFRTFTAISLSGRVLRYITLVVVARLFY